MTNKIKVYLIIIASSLLFAAGSLAYQILTAPKLPPLPAASEAEDETMQAAYYQQDITEGDRIAARAIYRQEDLDRMQPAGGVPVGGVAGADDAFYQRMQVYQAHPSMRDFNREMQAAMGDIRPEDLASGSFQDVFSNPQIQKILLKYTKDPAFMRMMQQMMADDAVAAGQKK